MINVETFASHLARALYLFRIAAAKDEQKAEFRLLVGMLQEGDVTVRLDSPRVIVNGRPVQGPAVDHLVQRLELHGVSEVVVPQDAPVSHVFDLLKALADQPGGADDIPSRLHASGAYRVSVSLQKLVVPLDESLDPTPPAPRTARESLGTAGLLRGDPMNDIKGGVVAGASDVESIDPSSGAYEPPPPAALAPPPEPVARPVPPPPAPAPPPAATPKPAAAVPPAEPIPEPRLSSPEIAKQAASDVFAPAAARSRESADILAELDRNPQSPAIGDTLAVLGRQVEGFFKSGKLELVLHVIAGIVRNEQKIPEGSTRRQYGIALKRMITKPVLQGIAQLAAVPAHATEAMIAIQRAGADGVEVLIDLLISAQSVAERRGVFNALTQVKQGDDQLIHMLGHPQWFVVRNVAELIGELGLESAIPALAKQLSHDDERVRKAVALALAKIGTSSTVEPLRRALRDVSLGVRMQVALGIGGRKASALAMPLVVAIEEEQDPEVGRELMLALGRIGSPDAVQALIKSAQPSGKLFSRKPTAQRVTAVEALRIAATPAAIGTLQGLASDSDKQVKTAAQQALADLKK